MAAAGGEVQGQAVKICVSLLPFPALIAGLEDRKQYGDKASDLTFIE